MVYRSTSTVPLMPARLPYPYYLFVTIGGGGVTQPATVARTTTAMIARAAFFISESSVPCVCRPLTHRSCGALVPKRHCGRYSIDRPPLSAAATDRRAHQNARVPAARIVVASEKPAVRSLNHDSEIRSQAGSISGRRLAARRRGNLNRNLNWLSSKKRAAVTAVVSYASLKIAETEHRFCCRKPASFSAWP
jgi:hypothetical protein